MSLVRCPQCGQILASTDAGVWLIQRKGLECAYEKPIAFKCPDCGLRWKVDEVPETGAFGLTRAS